MATDDDDVPWEHQRVDINNDSRERSAPVVIIRYCTQCKWQLRAQWYQGELLQTFGDVLGGVMLVPARGGVFRVEVTVAEESTGVWNRKTDGGFPEITELKRRVRDLVAPEMSLGHADG